MNRFMPNKNRSFLTIIALLGVGAFAAAIAAGLAGGVLQPSAPARNAALAGLIDHTGRAVSADRFTAKPLVVTFGYTHCPDVCPTTLSEMAGWIETLGRRADFVNFAFVTVDPARDTRAVLAEYVKAFDARITGLTGSEGQTAKAARAFKVYHRKVARKDSDYTVDHSTLTYLINAKGALFNVIAYTEDRAIALRKLEGLLAENAAKNANETSKDRS